MNGRRVHRTPSGFQVGQHVRRIAFTESMHGTTIPEIPHLIITRIVRIDSQTMRTYYRIHAIGQRNTWRYAEGAERFFETERNEQCD